MKIFRFEMFIRTNSNNQEFSQGFIDIAAKNYDDASDEFSKKEKPYHSFATVKTIN